MSLETSFAVKLFLLFDESNIVQFTFAIRHGATEMIRTPCLPQSRHELASINNKIKLLNPFFQFLKIINKSNNNNKETHRIWALQDAQTGTRAPAATC
jgi:hypothetical protein